MNSAAESILILGGSSQLTPMLLDMLDPDIAIAVTTTRGGQGNGSERRNVREIVYSRDAPEALAQELQREWSAVISLVPVTVLPGLLPLLQGASVGRLVALSTASVHTKAESHSPAEREFLRGIHAGEQAVLTFAEQTCTPTVLLRPAMTYGGGDNNIDFIRRMARKFGFFPVVRNSGLRQPVHAADVARAVMAALHSERAPGNTYFLGGGERLTFEQMTRRIMQADLGRARVFVVPAPLLTFALRMLSLLPRFAYLDPDMARRMREDHVFDNEPAHRDLDFRPREFLR